MVKKKDSSSKLILGLVVGVVLTTVVGVALYQANTSRSLTEMRVSATDPCEAYPKLSPVTTGTGTLHDKTDIGFNWWESGQSTRAKAVVLCAGAQFVREFGGATTYDKFLEGDKVKITGNFGDTTKTTILATLVNNISTSKAGEYKAKVATVNHAQSSFSLNGVTLLVAGKYGPYTLTVNYTPDTKCYFRTRQKPFACTNIAVGNTVVVTGVVYDPTLTLTAENIVVNY